MGGSTKGNFYIGNMLVYLRIIHRFSTLLELWYTLQLWYKHFLALYLFQDRILWNLFILFIFLSFNKIIIKSSTCRLIESNKSTILNKLYWWLSGQIIDHVFPFLINIRNRFNIFRHTNMAQSCSYQYGRMWCFSEIPEVQGLGSRVTERMLLTNLWSSSLS